MQLKPRDGWIVDFAMKAPVQARRVACLEEVQIAVHFGSNEKGLFGHPYGIRFRHRSIPRPANCGAMLTLLRLMSFPQHACANSRNPAAGCTMLIAPICSIFMVTAAVSALD
jgi:hypothetical protein